MGFTLIHSVVNLNATGPIGILNFFPGAFLYINFNLNLIYIWQWIDCEARDDIRKSWSKLVCGQMPSNCIWVVHGTDMTAIGCLQMMRSADTDNTMFEIRELPL
jgi:hypothetical protein